MQLTSIEASEFHNHILCLLLLLLISVLCCRFCCGHIVTLIRFHILDMISIMMQSVYCFGSLGGHQSTCVFCFLAARHTAVLAGGCASCCYVARTHLSLEPVYSIAHLTMCK